MKRRSRGFGASIRIGDVFYTRCDYHFLASGERVIALTAGDPFDVTKLLAFRRFDGSNLVCEQKAVVKILERRLK